MYFFSLSSFFTKCYMAQSRLECRPAGASLPCRANSRAESAARAAFVVTWRVLFSALHNNRDKWRAAAFFFLSEVGVGGFEEVGGGQKGKRKGRVRANGESNVFWFWLLVFFLYMGKEFRWEENMPRLYKEKKIALVRSS